MAPSSLKVELNRVCPVEEFQLFSIRSHMHPLIQVRLLGHTVKCCSSQGRKLILKAQHAVFCDSIRQRCQQRLLFYVPGPNTLLSMVSLDIILSTSLQNLWDGVFVFMEVYNIFPKMRQSMCPKSLYLYTLWLF